MTLVKCPSCSRTVSISDESLGRESVCPHDNCARKFTVGRDGSTSIPAEQFDLISEEPPVPIDDVVEDPIAPAPPRPRSRRKRRVKPPPVRRPRQEQSQPSIDDFPASGDSVDLVDSTDFGGWARGITFFAILIGLATVSIIGLLTWRNWALTEQHLAGRAEESFREGRYAAAQRQFRDLLETNSSSDHAPRWAVLADTCAIIQSTDGRDGQGMTQALASFAAAHDADSIPTDFMDEIQTAIRSAIAFGATEVTRSLSEPNSYTRASDMLASLERSVRQLARLFPPSSDSGESVIEESLAAARKSLAAERVARELVLKLDDIRSQAIPGSAAKIDQMIAASSEAHADIAQYPRILEIREEIARLEPQWVRYVPASAPRAASTAESPSAGILFCPPTVSAKSASEETGEIVFALIRGILYGLDTGTGQPIWAKRIGIDAQRLPVRVPGAPPLHELAVLYSPQEQALVALQSSTGRIQWVFPTKDQCPGGPIVAQSRIFLPSRDGNLYELDALTGRQIGHYETGLPLSEPGCYSAETRRLFIPAEEKRILVIDVESQSCVGVIYSNHSSAGLCGPPIFHSANLIICEESSDAETMIQVFQLDKYGPEASPIAHSLVPGTSAFPPAIDGQIMALPTRSGQLRVLRIPSDNTSESKMSGDADMDHFSPAQVVGVGLNEWWMLADGRLRLGRFDAFREVIHWEEMLDLSLGEPITAAQLMLERDFIVWTTQHPDSGAALATATNLTDGSIVWQRRMGMIASGIIQLDQEIIFLDQEGFASAIPPDETPNKTQNGWQTANPWPGQPDPGSQLQWSVPSRGSKTASWATVNKSDKRLRVFQHTRGDIAPIINDYPLISIPNGRPIWDGSSLMVPCLDGNLYEYSLKNPAQAALPIPWRDAGAAADTPCRTVLTKPGELYVSNGLRDFRRWTRSASHDVWQNDPSGFIELPAPIATPALSLTGPDGLQYLCAGDTSGTLHSVPTERRQSWRSWALEGSITSGPFLGGNRIGCVVNRSRLVWIDPWQDGISWDYQQKNSPIIGEPGVLGDRVLVTFEDGTIIMLNGENGSEMGRKQLGPGQASSQAAIFLTESRILCPLLDGTAIVLSVQ